MESFNANLVDESRRSVALPTGQAVITFFSKPVLQKARSIKEGREIYEERDFIRVQKPMSKDTRVREVTDQDKYQYAEQWAHYKATGGDNKIIGTPLTVFPGITEAIAAEMSSLGIKVVEQLAESDFDPKLLSVLGPDGVNTIRQAKKWLEDRKQAGYVQNLENKVKELEESFTVLQSTLKANGLSENDLNLAEENAALKLEIEKLKADTKKRGRARPRKKVVNESPELSIERGV